MLTPQRLACLRSRFCSALFAAFMLAGLVQGANAEQATPPVEVSALLYSSTAVELFWTPIDNNPTQIIRNGLVLGVFDARSLFQSGLDPQQQYRYELRSIHGSANQQSGGLSEPILIELTTAGFNLPIKRVLPLQDDSGSATDDGDSETGNEEPPPPPPIVDKNACRAGDVNSLRGCISNANAYRTVSIDNNIVCNNNSCCPGGRALLDLQQVNDLKIIGNGHSILRSTNQRSCSLLEINSSNDVLISDLTLDDDASVAGCQVADKCPRTLHIRNSSNIRFDKTHVANGKSYVIYVQKVNGFTFEHGSLSNSGVLGLYVGHDKQSSTNVQIRNNVFRDNQTNAVALLGVTGSRLDTNVIENNLFIRNHRLGQWQVHPRYGSGFTNGGQLYLAQADHVTIRNNQILDGYCDNCFVQQLHRSAVTGIEIGTPGKPTVRSLLISNNLIANHDGWAVSQNQGSALDTSVSMESNTFINNTRAEHLKGVVKSGNVDSSTQRFDSFESGGSLGSAYIANRGCAAASSVKRICDNKAVFGQCKLELQVGDASCGNPDVSVTGPAVKVSAGKHVNAGGWFAGKSGEWCIVFENQSYTQIAERCVALDNADISSVQRFSGLPLLQAQAPQSAAYARIRAVVRNSGARLALDDLKLSIR